MVDKGDGSRKEQRLKCRTDTGFFGVSVLAKKFPAPQRWMVEEEMPLDIPFALDLPVSYYRHLPRTTRADFTARLQILRNHGLVTYGQRISHAHVNQRRRTLRRRTGKKSDRVLTWRKYSTQEIATAEVVARRLLERPVYAQTDSHQSQRRPWLKFYSARLVGR
jgi:hypothetical protein